MRIRRLHFLQELKAAVSYFISYIPPIVRWVLKVAFVCLLAFIFVWNFGQRVSSIGDSMRPVLENGDVVLVNRLVYNARRPRRGDIIVFKPKGNENSHYYIKRVIALPGETVEIIENRIYIDGEKLDEPYETTNIDYVGLVSGEMKLKEDEYFVLGDDRESSEDSRNPEVGSVKRAYIYGKAWFVISPYENFGFIKE
ncbi:MAG: signal peptidase I [Lachnospiraceae bacterium]